MKSTVIALIMSGLCMPIYAANYSLQGPPLPNATVRNEIAYSDLPLEKPWEQFTAMDMLQLRQQYAILADNEEPPFPQGGLKSIIDELRVVQKRDSIEGDLFAIVNVDESGVARNVSFLETPGLGDLKAISGILTSAKYKPAKCGGIQCSMEFPVHITFKLNHSIVF